MPEEAPPLKLLIEPDEYLCSWILPDLEGEKREYPGAIDLRVSRPSVGFIYGDVPLEWTRHGGSQLSAGFPQTRHYPHLIARLANGYEADLVDVQVSFWSADHARVSAGSATVGIGSGAIGFGWSRRDRNGQEIKPDSQAKVDGEAEVDTPADIGVGTGPDATTEATSPPQAESGADTDSSAESEIPTYYRASVQVGALDAVAGVSPFAAWEFPKQAEGSRHLDGVWSITGNPDSSQEWADDQVTLSLEYDASVGVGDRYAFRFVVSPVLRLEVQQPLTIREWVDHWVAPLRRIVSIATGSSQDLTFLAVESKIDVAAAEDAAPEVPGRYRRRQVFGTGIAQKPYQSNSREVQRSATSLYLAVDDVSLLDMIRRWRTMETDHHPLIETYGAMLSADEEHPRSRFLLLVQAMEGLHGHETAEAYAGRQERHIATRQATLDAVTAAACLTTKQRDFLKSNLARRPLRGLDQALKHLLESLPVDLTPSLLDCELVKEAGEGATGSEQQRVAWALSQVRNDLAHGNRGYNYRALDEAVTILERVVRAHALRLLGCPAAVLERVCRG